MQTQTQPQSEEPRKKLLLLAPDGAVQADERVSVQAMQKALLGWYRGHRRDLPWRSTKSPYRKFLAEMMLQQTQVERVAPKYHAFIAQFPTVRRLSAAPLAEVIRLWAGMGYNRRAVYLHRAAQAVVRKHGGVFPMCLEALLRLPGVGAYTARALMSFVDNAPVAVVDTNVRRVLGRVLRDDLAKAFGHAGPTARQLQELADSLVPEGKSARWNQALMDLGSTVCTSRQPKCLRCPLFAWCQARQTGEFTDLPSLRPKGQGTFTGSRRYYRGRIIAALRESPLDDALAFRDIASGIVDQSPGELTVDWLWELTQDLERDGLVVISGNRESWSQATVMLPD